LLIFGVGVMLFAIIESEKQLRLSFAGKGASPGSLTADA
jgi:hypothetical protein